MILVGRNHIEDFKKKHQDSRSPLDRWKKTITGSTFKHLPDLKQTFRTADYDKPFTIFDIGGNNYRLISLILYESKHVTVRNVLTHDEYMKGNWRKN